MKNILIIQGGGRPNGNTAQLVEHFARGAKEAGHTVEVISLRKQEVKGCMGCNACRYGKPCVQKDSFNELVPKIKDADCIVFASPLLFWTISAQLKALIERFYCIAEEDPNPPLGRYEKYPSKDCALLMCGSPRASRAVGYALHFNPYPGVIPCHRVVNRFGGLAPAFAFGGVEVQAELLRSEGVEVSDDYKVDLAKYRFAE